MQPTTILCHDSLRGRAWPGQAWQAHLYWPKSQPSSEMSSIFETLGILGSALGFDRSCR